MALAINIMHGCNPSDEMCPQLQAEKTKVRLYLPLIKQQMASHVLYITNNTVNGLAVNITHGCGSSNEVLPSYSQRRLKQSCTN